MRLSQITLVVSALFVTGCVSPPTNTFQRLNTGPIDSDAIDRLGMSIETSQPVEFRGRVNYDDVGLEGNSMTYPGDTGAIFLASVAVHSIVVESAKAQEKQVKLKQANRVLEPYQPYLSSFTNGDLLGSVLGPGRDAYPVELVPLDGDQAPSRLLVSEPLFFMSQDEQQLILRHNHCIF